MAVRFYQSLIGLAMFNMVRKLFNVLCRGWENKLLACSTDSAANITGHIFGVVTRLSQVAKPEFIRVWCALHQIVLVMQAAYCFA